MSFTDALTAAVAAGFSTADEPVVVYAHPGGKIHWTPACTRLARRPGDEIVLTAADALGLPDTDWCQSCPELSGPWKQIVRACDALDSPNRFTNADTVAAWQHVAAQANVERFTAIAASATTDTATVTRAAQLAAAAHQRCVSLTERIDIAARVRRASLLAVGPRVSYGGSVPLLGYTTLSPRVEVRNRARRHVGSKPSLTYVRTWNRFAELVFAGVELADAARDAVVAGLTQDRTGPNPVEPDRLRCELGALTEAWVAAVAAAADSSLVTMFIACPDRLADAHTELVAGFAAAHASNGATYTTVPAAVAAIVDPSWVSGSSRPTIVTTDALSAELLSFAAKLYDPSDAGRLADPADAAFAAARIGAGCCP